METHSCKSTSPPRFAGLLFCLAAGVFLGMPGATTQAAISTWNGLGSDNNWSTGANWVSGNATGTSDALVFDGTTRLSSVNNLFGGSRPSITFASGAGAFTLSGNAITLAGNIVNSSTNAETINFSGITVFNGTRGLDASSGNIAIGSIIGSGGGSGVWGVSVISTSTGTGIVTLSGANTFTGVTSIVSGGTLSVSSLNSVVTGHVASSNLGAPTTATDGTIGIGSAATTGRLNYTGSGETTDRIINLGGTTGGATIDQSGASGLLKFTSGFTATGNGTKTLTLQGSTAGTGEIAGAIVNSASATSLAKAGSGTWALSGTNTYTGATSVNQGTLLINGSTAAASAVTVYNTGTLGGNGTIGGVVTVNSGGTLAPGNSPGLLTVGSLVLNAGSTTAFEIAGSTTRGGDYDAINVTTGGGLTLNGAFTINFTNLTALSNTTDINLFSYTGGYTGEFTSLVATGFADYAGTWTHVGQTFTWSSGGGQTLTFSELTGNLTIVPEPATWALLAFSLTIVMVLRRRRIAEERHSF